MFESRYRLTRLLGRGGFATVFLADDVASARQVALKILHPNEDGSYDRIEKARFEREARILGRLRDPHTVTMFAFGTAGNGLVYLVTEYVHGEDLTALIKRRGTLSSAEVAHITQQVLMSLRETHAHGLLHRDVKPGNIRVTQTADDPLHVKLLDFGIAKLSTGEGSVTKTGSIMGTPRYMAPEQLLSEEVTPASDLYSLGVVAVEMLCGSAGIQGIALADQVDRLAEQYVFPLPPGTDPQLAAVISRLTARSPTQRLRTAQAALDAFTHRIEPTFRPAPAQAPAPAPAPAPATLREENHLAPAPAPPGRKPWLIVAGLAALALLTTAVAIIVTLQAEEEVPAPPMRQLPGILAAPMEPSDPAEPGLGADLNAPSADAGPDAAADVAGAERARSTGCGREARPGMQSLPYSHAFAYVPADYDPDVAIPLVFMVHESFEPPDYFVDYSGMKKLADEHQFAIVAPEGKSPIAWDTRAELEIVRDAIDAAKRSLCIDLTRVYGLGHASGGTYVETAACDIGGVAAIANASRRGPPNQRPCPTPIPHLHIAPLHDMYNPVEGGRGCAGTDKISLADKIALYKDINECTGPTTTWFKHATSSCETWSCEAPFVVCRLDGGRRWPGAKTRFVDQFMGNCDGEPADFPYAETMWKFLSQYTLE